VGIVESEAVFEDFCDSTEEILVLGVGDKVGSDAISCAPAEEVYSIATTMSAAEQREEAAGPEAVSTFPVEVEGKPGEVNLEDIGESAPEAVETTI
jgi:hypothetical protein